jgi:hypothetical protein
MLLTELAFTRSSRSPAMGRRGSQGDGLGQPRRQIGPSQADLRWREATRQQEASDQDPDLEARWQDGCLNIALAPSAWTSSRSP